MGKNSNEREGNLLTLMQFITKYK
uniref:Uncharacterized protein n=1 Tax=Anguilla anguilla TaxID=7936 RepID=A0A0E9SMZ7_ANGAN